MKLPLLISVPHAGKMVPRELAARCILTEEEIIADGDEGAREAYDITHEVEHLVTTEVARAIVDMNRAPDDRRADGVVKTHTCWGVQVYREFPSEEMVNRLLQQHYFPYHDRLKRFARSGVVLGVDCHTMAAVGPAIGPMAGEERPAVCLSNAKATCPATWLSSMADCMREALGVEVSLNHPFSGGYIIRRHAGELPWMQLELSRAPFMSNDDKRSGVLAALREWCGQHRG